MLLTLMMVTAIIINTFSILKKEKIQGLFYPFANIKEKHLLPILTKFTLFWQN